MSIIIYKFIDLPSDVIRNIFRYFTPKDVIEYSKVHSFVHNSLNCEDFWETLCQIYFQDSQITVLSSYDIWMKGNFIYKWKKSKFPGTKEHELRSLKEIRSIRQKRDVSLKLEKKEREEHENYLTLSFNEKVNVAYQKIEKIREKIKFIEVIFNQFEYIKHENE